MDGIYYSLDGVPENMRPQFEAESTQLKLAVTNAIIGYLGGDPKEKNNPEQEGIHNQVLLNYLCMSIPKPEWGYGQSYALERLMRNRSQDSSIKNQLSFFEESIIGALENFSQIQGNKKLLSLFSAIRNLSWGSQSPKLRQATINIPIELLKGLDGLTLNTYMELLYDFSHDESDLKIEARDKIIEIIVMYGINSYTILSYIQFMCRKGDTSSVKDLLNDTVVREIYAVADGKKAFTRGTNPRESRDLQLVLSKIEEISGLEIAN